MTTSFSDSDVIALAKAVCQEFYVFESNDPYEGYFCNFCGEGTKAFEQEGPDQINHDLNCAVLVAKDLLTGVDA